MAAYNQGIEIIYIPLDNKNDLKQIPKKILDNLDIHLVDNYDTIYNDLFNKNLEDLKDLKEKEVVKIV